MFVDLTSMVAGGLSLLRSCSVRLLVIRAPSLSVYVCMFVSVCNFALVGFVLICLV